jgi:hypothetical protein
MKNDYFGVNLNLSLSRQFSNPVDRQPEVNFRDNAQQEYDKKADVVCYVVFSNRTKVVKNSS